MNKISDEFASQVKSITRRWLHDMPTDNRPVAVMCADTDTPITAVCWEPQRMFSTVCDLSSGRGLRVPSMLPPVAVAAAVAGHGAAGYVWNDQIACFPPNLRRAFHQLTFEIRMGLAPELVRARADELVPATAPTLGDWVDIVAGK